MNNDEQNYLNLIKNVLENGEIRNTRNSITKSLFSEKLEFDISNSIPFLTTKKLAWKTVINELLWFLSGSTDNQQLLDKNIKIWQGNSTREYMNNIGIKEREVNDLGPIYGHQWRHFNAKYIDHKTDYSNQGIDQINNIIYLLKNDPMSRRIILSAWNPCQLNEMNLPPCHILAQFYVSTNNELSCQMYQRSADIGLGLPFNIASYSVLTYILAKLTGLKPKKLYIIIGDAHIYQSHESALVEQIKRIPYNFPTLIINENKVYNNISDFDITDFAINNYTYHDLIKIDMIA